MKSATNQAEEMRQMAKEISVARLQEVIEQLQEDYAEAIAKRKLGERKSKRCGEESVYHYWDGKVSALGSALRMLGHDIQVS